MWLLIMMLDMSICTSLNADQVLVRQQRQRLPLHTEAVVCVEWALTVCLLALMC